LGDDAAIKFKVGVSYNAEGRWLVFPYFKEGVCVNLKYRSLPPLEKSFRFKPKHEKPLYNIDAIKNFDDVLIFEGESDLISAVMMGYPNACALPTGAGNFSSDHWDTLIKKRKIYLLLDYDGAGRAGVTSVATRLGPDRCYNVRIPNGMDVNDLLIKFGYEEGKKRLDACIEDAKPFGESSVSSVGQALGELQRHLVNTGSVESGYASPWPSVTRMLGLVGEGEVILVLAIPKTGKTTFCLQWLAWLSRHHDVPTMMFCLEMPMWRLAQSLTSHVTYTPRDRLTSTAVSITQLQMMGKPLFFGEKPREWTFQKIKDTIAYAVQRFGIKVVCFDNLHLLVRSLENQFQEQAQVSRDFKLLASELNIAILLVVQPRKMDPTKIPGFYDPAGSSSIIADADGLLSLWRRPLLAESMDEDAPISFDQESFAPETIISVPASRYRQGGRAQLFCSGDIATFSEMGSVPLIPAFTNDG
jgi:hypothetical protein